MGKFDGMLFCTDLDGTLYSTEKTVSKENLDAIDYFKSEGGLFTFITGRPPCIATDVYTLIDPNAPFGCVNGGGIYDHREKKFLWRMLLSESVRELVRDVAAAFPDAGVQFNTENDIYFVQESDTTSYFREMTHYEGTQCRMDDVTVPILKVMFSHYPEERLEALMVYLAEHPASKQFDLIRSERIFYEVLPKGISKGAALTRMADLLSVDMANTVAVGDYHNDISMIQAAGIGYGMANAHPDVKAIADRITVDNDHHAIAAIVEELERNMSV